MGPTAAAAAAIALLLGCVLLDAAQAMKLAVSARQLPSAVANANPPSSSYPNAPMAVPYYHPRALDPVILNPAVSGRGTMSSSSSSSSSSSASPSILNGMSNVPAPAIPTMSDVLASNSILDSLNAADVGSETTGTGVAAIGDLTSDIENAAGMDISSIAPDDFGFSELQKEQEELHRDSLVVLQQKQAIEKAEQELEKFQEKIKQDKETLAENQENLRKWTREMIEHVNAYRDALLAAQLGGIGSTGAATSAGSNKDDDDSPSFRSLRPDTLPPTSAHLAPPVMRKLTITRDQLLRSEQEALASLERPF